MSGEEHGVIRRPCPELWLVGEAVEIARFDLGPDGVVIFRLCAVCGRWHSEWQRKKAGLKIRKSKSKDEEAGEGG